MNLWGCSDFDRNGIAVVCLCLQNFRNIVVHSPQSVILFCRIFAIQLGLMLGAVLQWSGVTF